MLRVSSTTPRCVVADWFDAKIPTGVTDPRSAQRTALLTDSAQPHALAPKWQVTLQLRGFARADANPKLNDDDRMS